MSEGQGQGPYYDQTYQDQQQTQQGWEVPAPVQNGTGNSSTPFYDPNANANTNNGYQQQQQPTLPNPSLSQDQLYNPTPAQLTPSEPTNGTLDSDVAYD
jgi:hypothetical protein